MQITGLNALFAAAVLATGLVLHDNKLFTMIPTDNSPGLALCQSTDATHRPDHRDVDATGDVVGIDPDGRSTIRMALSARSGASGHLRADQPPHLLLRRYRRCRLRHGLESLAHLGLPIRHHGVLRGGGPCRTGPVRDAEHRAGRDVAIHRVHHHPPPPQQGRGLPAPPEGGDPSPRQRAQGVVAWIRGGYILGGSNVGMVVAMNEQDGWHHILDPSSTVSGFPSSTSIIGGGLGPYSAVTVLSDGTVWEQDFLDSSNSRSTPVPPAATTAPRSTTSPPRPTSGRPR